MSDVLPLVDAASWRIATEICRRSPELLIRLLHPGGGQYDCLALMHPQRGTLAHLNRLGRLHVMARLDGRQAGSGPTDIWRQLPTRDSRALVDTASTRIGQRVPRRLPATSPRVLTYRLIATLVGMHIFGPHVWTCRNVVHDSSGMERTYIDWPLLKRFPLVAAEVGQQGDEAQWQRAYTFWVLLKNNAPVLCLAEDGRAWDRNAHEHDVSAMYREGRRLAPLVWTLIGNHLD